MLACYMKLTCSVWTETRDELTLLFTRAQQAQNDKYKKILITLIGLKLTFRAKHRYFTNILQYVQYVNFALIF